MRFYCPLDKLLDSAPKVQIFRFFCKTGTQTNGRELAKFLSLSPTTIHKAMSELLNEQVILMKKVGRAHSFCLNDTHWMVDKVLKPLFGAEDKLMALFQERLQKEISGSQEAKRILCVALFGSVVEHKERPDSDVDLLVVVKEEADVAIAEELIADIGQRIMPDIGMLLEPLVYSLKDFRHKLDVKQAALSNAVRMNLVLFGQSPEALV